MTAQGISPQGREVAKTCIILAGPTAAGKTSMAIDIAKHFNTKIISADSRQCYRELNIGVAKPSATALSTIPHYFINSHSIFQEVNAAAFEDYALTAATEIFNTADYAVVTGGTGLYIKAFCEGMDGIPEIPAKVRMQVIDEYENAGLRWLQEEVKNNDPEYYERGETFNPQRLMRALEVKRYTGFSILSYHSASKKKRPFRIVKTALGLPREQLYRNINSRVDQMMESGLLKEAESLFTYEHLNALQTVGYKELFESFKGLCSTAEAVENIKKHTRHYAKRQMTWFKKDNDFKWFSPDDFAGLVDYIKQQA